MKALHRYKIVLLLIGILFTAAFLRLYRIAEYLTFLGDEGRDVLVVKGILEGNLVFLGPRASSGDFFLGPIYYYLMAPFLWLWGLNPVGPAIMIAVLGSITVYLVYRMGREFFGVPAGIIASALYAVSVLVVQYSKSSWNPNAVPFFTIILMYCLYKAVKLRDWKYYLGVGVLFGILMQLHYIIVFLGVIIAVFVLLGNIFFQSKELSYIQSIRTILQGFLASLLGFLLGFSPFLAFEIKNGFPNFRTIFSFVTANTVGGEASGAPFYWTVSDVFLRVFGRLLLAFPSNEVQLTLDPVVLGTWIVSIVLIALVSLLGLLKTRDKLFALLMFLWLTLGIILFGFYKKPIYDYYFVFLFPVPFLLLGNVLGMLYEQKKAGIVGKLIAIVLIATLIFLNLSNSHLRTEPNRQLMQMQNIAEFALSRTHAGPYNFALITEGNSDHAYRFFFSLHDRNPVVIENVINDPNRKTVTDQLLIICEEVPCSPLGHPLYEVASFGRAEIDGSWKLSLDHGRIYETPDGEKPFVEVFLMKHYAGEEK